MPNTNNHKTSRDPPAHRQSHGRSALPHRRTCGLRPLHGRRGCGRPALLRHPPGPTLHCVASGHHTAHGGARHAAAAAGCTAAAAAAAAAGLAGSGLCAAAWSCGLLPRPRRRRCRRSCSRRRRAGTCTVCRSDRCPARNACKLAWEDTRWCRVRQPACSDQHAVERAEMYRVTTQD